MPVRNRKPLPSQPGIKGIGFDPVLLAPITFLVVMIVAGIFVFWGKL